MTTIISTERKAVDIALLGHNNAVKYKATPETLAAHSRILSLVVNAYNKARGNQPHILPRGNTGETLTLNESYPSTFDCFEDFV